MTIHELPLNRPLLHTGVAQQAAIRGATDMAPVVAALVPLALLLGATIAESPIDSGVGWAGAALVYAGAPCITAVSLLGAGASALAVVTAVWIQTARGVVYSAGMATRMRGQPAWFRWAGPYLLVDPLFALVTSGTSEPGSARELRWYYLGAGLAIFLMWMPTVALGILLGPALTRAAWIEFALPALFIAFLVPWFARRPALVAAAVGGVVAAAALALPGGQGLLLGAVAGMVAALTYERSRS